MFILLKHTNKYKGILLITHIEHKLLSKLIKNGITNKYFIYGVWCNGYPSSLKSSLATYFTDKQFYYNRINEENNFKIKKLLNNLMPKYKICFNNKKIFDFIHIGRCCAYKNTLETYNIIVRASVKYNKKSLLVLIKDIGNDKDLKYFNNIKLLYNKLDSKYKNNILLITDINNKNNEYCISNSLNYHQLSLLFNYSKIYIHSKKGFDESRILGQALLSSCLILCSKKLKGHLKTRKLCKNSFVEYDNFNNINFYIDLAIKKQKKYIFNEKINNIYNEEITVINELKKYYKECNYNNILSLDNFIEKCDKKLWSLKIAGHYNNVEWNVKKKNEYKYGNPTHHIQSDEQFNIFLKYIKINE